MEVSSSDSDVDEEEQKKIDEGLKTPRTKKEFPSQCKFKSFWNS